MEGANDAPPPPAPVTFTLKKPLKITKVARPKVEAEAAVLAPVVSPEEEERDFVLQYQKLRCGIYKLDATATLGPVLELGAGEETCFVFDFDQTLHLREHLRGRCVELLRRLQHRGAPFCIVTAAQPRASSVRALANELHDLGLDDFFHTTRLDRNGALEWIRRNWGDNDKLSEAELQRKLLVLFALLTDRRPADLSRVGFSGIVFEASGASSTYRMQRGVADWSAQLVLQGSPLDAAVCPVACLRAYVERISQKRVPPVYKEIDLELDMPEDILLSDRLFLKDDNTHVDVQYLESLIEEFLVKTCQYPAWQVQGLLRDPCFELNVNGIQMARFGSLIAAKYNKAEAVEYFLKEHPSCKSAVFVDDNFDNVFNVFLRFAQLEQRGPSPVVLHSVWYEPPADGKPEVRAWFFCFFFLTIRQPCDARRATLGSLIWRKFPDAGPPRVALCDFGVMGTMELRQPDNLAPLECAFAGETAATVTFADTHDGAALFQGPVITVAVTQPSFVLSLFGDRSLVGKWAILRVEQSVATAKVAMK
jgi:hypothetical protein